MIENTKDMHMGIFKGQNNDILKDICSERDFEVIIPHNFTNKF